MLKNRLAFLTPVSLLIIAQCGNSSEAKVASLDANTKRSLLYRVAVEQAVAGKWAAQNGGSGPTLSIKISNDGSIASVDVSKTSGDKSLDEEAVELAKKCGPFPPPTTDSGPILVPLPKIDFTGYMSKVQRTIRSHWSPPKSPESLHTIVRFQIMRDGSTIEPVLDKSSHNAAFDKLALLTVQQCNFDPLPSGALEAEGVQFQFDYNVCSTVQVSRFKNVAATKPLSSALPLSITEPSGPVSDARSKQAAELNNQGVTALSKKDYATAIKKLEEALKCKPGYRIARENLAIAYNNYALTVTLDDDERLKWFRKCLVIDRANQTTKDNIAALIRGMGKDPNSAKTRLLFAQEARETEDWDGAIAEYSAALEAENNRSHKHAGPGFSSAERSDIYKSMSECLLKRGDPQRAITALVESLKANSGNTDAAKLLVKCWQQVVSTDSQCAENHIGLGQAYELTGDFSNAQAEFEKALTIAKGNPMAQKLLSKLPEEKLAYEAKVLRNAGVRLQSQKQYDEALAKYLQVAKMRPDDSMIWLDMATCLEQKKDYGRALKAYQKVLALKPEDVDAINGLKTCEAALNSGSQNQSDATAKSDATAQSDTTAKSDASPKSADTLK